MAKNPNHEQEPIVTDERTQQNTEKAALITLLLTWLALIVTAIVKYIRSGDISSITEELLLFIGMIVVFLIVKSRTGDIDLPKSLNGKVLPVGTTPGEKRKRRLSYIKESLIDAAAFTVIDFFFMMKSSEDLAHAFVKLESPGLNLAVNTVIHFFIMFALFLILTWCLGEHKVRKYRIRMAELDDEELEI